MATGPPPGGSSDIDLRQKVAVVTSAGGLGRAVAEELAASGALVYCADLSAGEAEATAAIISAAGGIAEGRSVDFVEHEEVDALAAEVVNARGALDIFCNVCEPPATGRSLLDLDEHALDRALTRVLAAELGESGVRVNATVATTGAAGTPGWAALSASALYLAADASGPLTGHVLRPGAVPGDGH